MANFEKAMNFLLKHEGGLSEDPHDPGGITKFGISLRFMRYYFPDTTTETIKELTEEKATLLYGQFFWTPYQLYAINNDAIANKVFDMAVHMGGQRAIELLQKAYNRLKQSNFLKVDGIIGKETLKHINKLIPEDAIKLLVVYKSECVEYYTYLIDKNPRLEKYRKGWMKRGYE